MGIANSMATEPGGDARPSRSAAAGSA